MKKLIRRDAATTLTELIAKLTEIASTYDGKVIYVETKDSDSVFIKLTEERLSDNSVVYDILLS